FRGDDPFPGSNPTYARQNQIFRTYNLSHQRRLFAGNRLRADVRLIKQGILLRSEFIAKPAFRDDYIITANDRIFCNIADQPAAFGKSDWKEIVLLNN